MIDNFPKDLTMKKETILCDFKSKNHKIKFEDYCFDCLNIVFDNLNNWVTARTKAIEDIFLYNSKNESETPSCQNTK